MPKLHGVKPHPAFPLDLLGSGSVKASTIGGGGWSSPSTSTTSPTKGSKGSTGQQHYPPDYLETLGIVKQDVDAPHDIGGMAATILVGQWASWLVAFLNPLWLLDSGHYNTGAFMTEPRQTIYLRRMLLMTTILASHGLASVAALQLRSLLFGTDETATIQLKLGEWQSHRVHQQSFLQAFPPGVFTRVLMVFLQGFSACMSFWAYLLYPPLVLSIDRHMNAYATQVHTDALHALDKKDNQMSRIDTATAPPQAQWFWSLPAHAPFRDVLLSIRADDTCHSLANDVALDHRKHPVAAMERYLDLMGVRLKGQ